MRHDERYWYTVSTKNDFLCKTNGMQPIQNIPGINNEEISWFVHPETGNIVHLVKVLHRAPLEDFYIWKETIYNPNADTGFNESGHKMVKVEGKTYPLHRIIALTFIENHDPARTIVYHINGNKRDNRASNLTWVSPKELAEYKKNAYKPRIRLNLKPKQ